MGSCRSSKVSAVSPDMRTPSPGYRDDYSRWWSVEKLPVVFDKYEERGKKKPRSAHNHSSRAIVTFDGWPPRGRPARDYGAPLGGWVFFWSRAQAPAVRAPGAIGNEDRKLLDNGLEVAGQPWPTPPDAPVSLTVVEGPRGRWARRIYPGVLRLFDILFSSMALIVSMPLMIAIIVVIVAVVTVLATIVIVSRAIMTVMMIVSHKARPD